MFNLLSLDMSFESDCYHSWQISTLMSSLEYKVHMGSCMTKIERQVHLVQALFPSPGAQKDLTTQVLSPI